MNDGNGEFSAKCILWMLKAIEDSKPVYIQADGYLWKRVRRL